MQKVAIQPRLSNLSPFSYLNPIFQKVLLFLLLLPSFITSSAYNQINNLLPTLPQLIITPSTLTTMAPKVELNEPLTQGQRGEFTDKSRALMERFDATNRVMEEYDEGDYVEGKRQLSIGQFVTMRLRARREEVKHLRNLQMVLAQLQKFYRRDNTSRRVEDVVFAQGLTRQNDRPLVLWDPVGSKRAREGDDNDGGDSPSTKKPKSGGLAAPPWPPSPVAVPKGTKHHGMFTNVKRHNVVPGSPTDPPGITGTKYTGMFANVPHKRHSVVPDSPTYVPASPITAATPVPPVTRRTPASPSSAGSPGTPFSPGSPLSILSPLSPTPHSSVTPPSGPRPFVLGYVSGSVFDADSPVGAARRSARRRHRRERDDGGERRRRRRQ